jgi:hypothetical protein
MAFNLFPTSIGSSQFDGPFFMTIDGIMGENGWYISPINITITIDPEVCKGVGYNIGDGWQLYQEPFTISKEGRILINFYWIDLDGNKHFFNFHIRIDISTPIVKISKYPEFDQVLIDVRANDYISKIERLEFYIDDELYDVYYDSSFIWSYNGKGSHLVYVKAFDHAGLYNESEKITIRTPRIIYSNNYKLLRLLYYIQNHICNILQFTTV